MAAMIPYTPTPGIEPRVVITFPLNGVAFSGEEIYLLEDEATGLEAAIPCPYMRQGVHGDQWCHDTLADALRVALNNSGWGTYQIKDVTND